MRTRRLGVLLRSVTPCNFCPSLHGKACHLPISVCWNRAKGANGAGKVFAGKFLFFFFKKAFFWILIPHACFEGCCVWQSDRCHQSSKGLLANRGALNISMEQASVYILVDQSVIGIVCISFWFSHSLPTSCRSLEAVWTQREKQLYLPSYVAGRTAQTHLMALDFGVVSDAFEVGSWLPDALLREVMVSIEELSPHGHKERCPTFLKFQCFWLQVIDLAVAQSELSVWSVFLRGFNPMSWKWFLVGTTVFYYCWVEQIMP